MLQIISNSNETSTGAELVQNGDFSELGSDLVTNGDFSAAGSNLVSNPNFSATGSELVTNGDFATDSDWGSNNTISGGQLTKTSSGPSLQGGVVAAGKSYQVTVDVASLGGAPAQIYAGGNNSAALTVGVQTIYITGGSTNASIGFNNGYSGFGIVINSISVKELGEDWVPQPIDPDSTSFDENGLTLVQSSDLGDNSRVYQLNVTEADKSYKVTYVIHSVSLTSGNSVQYYDGDSYENLPEQGVGTHTFYYTREGTNNNWIFNLRAPTDSPTDFVTISSLVVQELGEGWNLNSPPFSVVSNGIASDGTSTADANQSLFPTIGKSYKIVYTIASISSGGYKIGFGGVISSFDTTSGTYTKYVTAIDDSGYNARLRITPDNSTVGTISSISVQQLDPNGYWTLGTGWSIGTNKAISTVTGSESDITQSILTAGKTYQTVFEVVDFTAGTVQAVVTGDEGTDRTAIETYTESLTATGTDFSIRSKLGTFDGSVSSVSAKLVGSYSDQSIYVTAADVQTIPQASVYYLVELTSMGSENSLYFLPSSVVANNGRYTKLNFTVVSKDALTQPTVGIISFYDSAGGFDTYPMGFYEFKIYEQTSSTNLDPTLATGLLEKGFAFVRDFSGNMQELTDGFNEYDPTLTQYVYSK